MHPTMPSEYFFVSNSVNKFVEVTTRDKQLLKLSKTCSILINLSSVYVNPNFLYKKKDRFTWFQIAAIVWFLSLTLSKTKVLCRYLRIFIHFSLIFGKLMIASIVLFIYLLNKIVLNFKVFKLMAFLAFFIFLFSLLNANFIHTNIFLYTNSYTNFVTRELCLRNGLAGTNHSVQWENKLTLLHKNFEFLKNAVRNFNFILGYTIFTLISIIRKSFKRKSRLNFPFYSIIFLTLIILKPALESTNFDLQSYLRKCFTKDLFSFLKVLDLCNRLHDSYNHYFIVISVLKYKNYSKFYQMLFLLSGDMSLSLGPTPNSAPQSFWKPFENKGLRFLYLNINSILPKLDELKAMARNTKTAIIGIKESKVDNSISDSEVEIQSYCTF